MMMAADFSTIGGKADATGKGSQTTDNASGSALPPRTAQDGLNVRRRFCPAGVAPFDSVRWEKRSASIKGEKGELIFNQTDIEAPASWSQLAVNVVASKYFYGERDKPERENSVRHLVNRVTRTIADWAKADGMFASDADANTFYEELTWLCVNQYGSFNSPVWFNVG